MSRPMRESLSDKSLSIIGIPKSVRNKSIEDFDTKGNKSLSAVKDYIKEYIENLEDKYRENEGLFLYGSNGVGKTMLASIVVKEAYRRRYRAKRVYFQDYVQLYTSRWGMSAEEREEVTDTLKSEYASIEFLCIEEIGKEVDSRVNAPILEDLLRYREDHNLPTIVCTNLDIDSIEEHYGTSVVSLIKGNMTPILIEGKDKRSNYYVKRTTN